MGRLLALVACLVQVSVVACGDEDRLRPPWERADAAAAPTARDGAAATLPDGGTAFPTVEGRVDLEGSRATVGIGGLRFSPGGLVRAWLEADLDADGDVDGVVLHDRPAEDPGSERALELLALRREQGEELAAGGATVVGPTAPAIGCVLEAAALRAAAPGIVTLRTRSRCADGPHSSALLLEGPFPLRPRVWARLDGEAVELATLADDRDRDGAVDAVLQVRRGRVAAELVWLDRAAGPSLDGSATERSLDGPLRQRGGGRLIDRAQAVVDLHRLLCTGTLEGSTLTVVGQPARECRTSRAVGAAVAMLVNAHLRAGAVPEARSALSQITLPGVGLGEARRTELERAVAERTTLPIDGAREVGPRIEVAGPGVPAVRFLDDDRVRVDGAASFVYVLSRRAVEPVTDPAPPATRMPDAGATAARGPTAVPGPARARAGGRRAVATAEGLWIGEAEQWGLVPASRLGGSWSDVVALALSPAGGAVAACRGGRLEIVRLRERAEAHGAGTASDQDRGSGDAGAGATGGRGP